MRTPDDGNVEFVQVGDGFDEADEWIVDDLNKNDIVVTTDIPLASECLKKFAKVLSPKGREFSHESIGDALASREVASQLREHGLMGGGPAPFDKRDRSRFLERLDALIHACK